MHMEFNFPHKTGLGIVKFLGHVSSECQDLISKLLTYNPEERYSAKQALSHPYFKNLLDQEIKLNKMTTKYFLFFIILVINKIKCYNLQ